MTLGGTQLTEHGRQGFQLSPDPIVTDVRLANGTMKRYFVATKRKFSFSWNMLPALDSQTLDNKTGRNTLRTLYDANIDNSLTFIYKEVDSNNNQTDVTTTVFIESYSESLEKRWDSQFWNVNLSLVEQ